MTECVCPALDPGPTVNTVPIAPLSMEGTLQRLQTMLACPATHVINHVPADVTVHARRNLPFREAVVRADLNVADGMGVVWGCRALGYRRMRERVYGPDFMELVAQWGLSSGLKHFLLGGSDEVLAQLIRTLEARHPQIRIVGALSPAFRPVTARDLSEFARHISKAAPDVVWVGLGTPKQQLVAAQLSALVDVRAILTVGAAFDFLSGAKRQAPKWAQRRGMEWLFRLACEPRRLAHRYLVGLPCFAVGLSKDLIASRSSRRDR